MPRSHPGALLSFLSLMGAVCCLDPLYEQGEEQIGGWGVCCGEERLDICLCAQWQCTPFRACAEGRCVSPSRRCDSWSGYQDQRERRRWLDSDRDLHRPRRARTKQAANSEESREPWMHFPSAAPDGS